MELVSLQECLQQGLHLTSLWFLGGHKLKKKKSADSTNCCTAPMLSLCLCLVWKFANRWSKQHDCCWLSGDMKGGKMEPRQRAACRQGSWASTVGYLSSPPASADVTISSVWAACTSSHLAACSLTWFSALQITPGENLQPVSPLRGRDRRQSRRGGSAGSAVIYLLWPYIKNLPLSFGWKDSFANCPIPKVQENID